MSDFGLPTQFGRGGGGGGRRGGGGTGRGHRGGGRHRGGGSRRGGGGRRGYHQGRGGRGGGPGRHRYGPSQGGPETIEELGTFTSESLSIAIQGCCHGELDNIYSRLETHERTTGQTVDVLVCCGDFQSLRSKADYHSLAVPPKYRTLGSFCRYYSGERKAPYLTIFIGGNHEASQPLHELYYGGWVAPNIYYLGAAGVVNIGGVRICGVSGIYKSHDYTQGRFERPPYDRSTMRSVYHVRNVDVYRLKCLSQPLDICLSHDWPQGIEQHGNTAALLRQKPFFREEVERNDLGSRPNRELLDALRPQWWFSAHLHVKFKATVQHNGGNARSTNQEGTAARPGTGLVPSQVASISKKEDKGNDDNNREEEAPSEPEMSSTTTRFQSLEPLKSNCTGPDLTDQMTQFLALDKCLPRRQHLVVLHVPCKEPKVLRYDVEWLAILKKTHHLTETHKRRARVPADPMPVTSEEMDDVRNRLRQRRHTNEAAAEETDYARIPDNFRITVPPHDDPCYHQHSRSPPPPYPMMGNPQTDELLELLGLGHVITVPYVNSTPGPVEVARGANDIVFGADANEIDLDDDNQEDENEIDLEDDDGEGEDENEIALDDVENAETSNPEDENEIDLDDNANQVGAGGDANEIVVEGGKEKATEEASPLTKKPRM